MEQLDSSHDRVLLRQLTACSSIDKRKRKSWPWRSLQICYLELIFKQLIHFIYFLDVTGNSALQIALENGHIDCIQLVLNEKGTFLI